MDELLQRLREEGRPDDTGRFTLDPARAREVMARYQSASPERYPLMFVAAACALGASSLSLQDESRFLIEGAELKPHEVEHLFSYLLQDGPLRYLGMGMLMAEQLASAYVRLSSSGARLTLKKGKTFLEKAPPGPMTIEVRPRRQWLPGLVEPMAPRRVLRNWAALAPIPIVLERTPLERVYRPEQPLLGTLVVGNLPVDAPGLVERLPSPGGYQAALTVGARRETAAGQDVVPLPGEVWCVVDGVAYKAPGLLPYWLRGVIVTPLARPDLSMTTIVLTDELRALAEELMDLLSGLIETLAEGHHRDAADEVRSYAAWRGGPQGIRLLKHVLELPTLTTDEKTLTLMQLAAMETACGWREEAERHLRLALTQIQERPRRMDALQRLSELLIERAASGTERAPVLRDLLALLDKVGRPDPRILQTLDQLAVVTEGDEARKVNARLLEMREAELGTNHPELTPILNRLARLCAKKRPLDAEHYRQRSLEIWSYAQGRGCEPPAEL